MNVARCILGKLLVVPTFAARFPKVSKDARDPSGERWNYLSRNPSGNFAETTASTPFWNLFLAISIRQKTDGDIKIICYEHVFKK
jgi:hypothetical protein